MDTTNLSALETVILSMKPTIKELSLKAGDVASIDTFDGRLGVFRTQPNTITPKEHDLLLKTLIHNCSMHIKDIDENWPSYMKTFLEERKQRALEEFQTLYGVLAQPQESECYYIPVLLVGQNGFKADCLNDLFGWLERGTCRPEKMRMKKLEMQYANAQRRISYPPV